MSYKSKDRGSGNLFAELMPFGGKLRTDNRWMKLHDLIPWEELEEIYRKYFSELGRPGKDSQLINGLLILKHQKVISDEETVEEFFENPYIQYFCGYDQFVTGKEIDSSTLSNVRKRLGVEYFKKFEEEILNVLKAKKIIKSEEQQIDATVFPSNVTYPTDTGLLERVRVWLVERIGEIEKKLKVKERARTYCRVARGVYLKFQKKRKKKVKEVQKAKKQLLQYVRRNIEQIKKALEQTGGIIGETKIKEKLTVAETIYRQQLEMLKKKIHSIEERIVSFHKPHIRPIVRGKSGKEVEFGPKASVSLVDGYIFLDKFSTEAYNEGSALSESLELHKKRFGKKPGTVITDKIYGSKDNRDMLKEEGIKAALVPLGRKSGSDASQKVWKWIKQKQKKRNRIEGSIGVSKVHYGLERLLYKDEELNIRLGLLAVNLSTAMARI